MKYLTWLMYLSSLMCSCFGQDNHKSIQAEKADTLITQTLSGNDAIKRIMDSILKAAGPNAKISIEGADHTKISENETKDLKASSLKIINTYKLDSLILSSDKKFTLLHFWATWCGPCRIEFPDYIKAVEQLNNVTVILISCDYDSEEQRKNVLAVYKKLNTTIPVYINQIYNKTDGMGTEAQRDLIKHFGISSEGGLPFNILIENRSRKVLEAKSSYIETIKNLN
jgi:thiol-disulfide isomerase/thioredoxin